MCGPAPLFLSVISNVLPTNPSLQDPSTFEVLPLSGALLGR